MTVHLRLVQALVLSGSVVCFPGCHAFASSNNVRETPVPKHAPPGAVLSYSAMRIDDSMVGDGVGEFHYSGKWERVRGRYDGRWLGTSTRSFHRGDVASISFEGRQIRIFGIRGLKDGYALASIDGGKVEAVDFHGGGIRGQSGLVYASPILARGLHTLAIVVTYGGPIGGGSYVNIDYAEIDN